MNDEVKEIKKDVEMLQHIINGNGERGMAAKVTDHEAWIKLQIKNRNDFATWLFRAFVGIILTYLALKAGLPTEFITGH